MAKLVLFQDGELLNKENIEYPISGWIYLSGASLKGQAPKTFESLDEIVADAKKIAKADKKKGNVYFNVAENGSAVIDL